MPATTEAAIGERGRAQRRFVQNQTSVRVSRLLLRVTSRLRVALSSDSLAPSDSVSRLILSDLPATGCSAGGWTALPCIDHRAARGSAAGGFRRALRCRRNSIGALRRAALIGA